MKLIFAGTPLFAAIALSALHAAGHEIMLVLTRQDAPAGRGQKIKTSEVSQFSESLGLPVLKPFTLKDEAIQRQIYELQPDVMVVAAYGLILPQAVLDIPRLGCLNIHGSLLPRWRGAAPIQRAIEAGDQETGICIMQMEKGLDTGAVLLTKKIRIENDETSSTLVKKMSILGGEAIVESLAGYSRLIPHPQDESYACYAKKILKSEAKIDWHANAHEIERRIRAFDPFPGSETTLNGEKIKIWRTIICDREKLPTGVAGEIIVCSQNELIIACGEGYLSVITLQRPGGKRSGVIEFMHGTNIRQGMRLV